MKNALFIVLMIMTMPSITYSGCWSAEEKSKFEFTEFDEVVLLSFKDAVDCSPISQGDVEIMGEQYQSDNQGYVKVPTEKFEEVEDRKVGIVVRKEGYITFRSYLNVVFGSVWNKKNLMSKRLKIGEMRFVLQWDNDPEDLDLHLVTDKFHISYRNKNNVSGEAKLDIDARHGYGPETITLKNIRNDKFYKIYVHHYSGKGTIDQKAQVHVYRDNELDKVVSLPKTSRRYVSILELLNSDINYINKPKLKIVR